MRNKNKTLRIALSMRVTGADTYVERRDSISHDWIAQLDKWAMTPLLIPNAISGPTAYLDRFSPDLLILTGGDDLGETPDRDQTETDLLQHTIKIGMPVLGVCRGLQLINLFFGGRASPVKGHVATRHTLEILEPLSSIYGDRVEVNSYHDQSIGQGELGDDLISSAVDKSGMVEAAVHKNKPIAGIMWHPERSASPGNERSLIEKLVSKGAFWT